MTSQEYRARLRAFGLTAIRLSYDGATIYQSRDGSLCTIPDPEPLSEEEREVVLQACIFTHGLTESN